MRFEKLIAKDFLTYKEVEYDFVNEPLLVQGNNLTDEGQKSNGSGKSGLQTIIEFCITASNSRGVKDNELVSYGEKQANAQLIIACDSRKERVHINWVIKVKGSNKLTITKQQYGGNWEEVSFSNVNDGKKWITNWFGITKEDLFNYFLINKTRFKSFFESSNKEKVSLINRFSDASIVEGIEKIDTSELETLHIELEKELTITETKIEEKKLSLYKENNRDLKKELEEIIYDLNADIGYEEDHILHYIRENNIIDTEIKELPNELKDYESDLAEDLKTLEYLKLDLSVVTKQADEVSKELDKANELVDNFVGIDKTEDKGQILRVISKLESKIESKQGKVDEYNDKKQQLKKLIEKINVRLSGSIDCPKCEHEFILDGDLEELESKKTSANKLIKAIGAKVDLLESGISKLNSNVSFNLTLITEYEEEENDSLVGKTNLIKAVSEISSKLNLFEKQVRIHTRGVVCCQDDISELKAGIKDILAKEKTLNDSKEHNNKLIKEHKDIIKTLKAKIKASKPQINLSEVSLLEESINELEALKSELTAKKKDCGDEIYKLNQWKNNFKQFKLHLANQSLSVIEYHNNRYLNEMGSDMRVKFEGQKILANGNVKDEITSKVIRNQERSFNSFSGGERGRLLFASILANRHMINSTHPHGGLDFLSIDEVFEGVDSVGLKGLIKLAKVLEITVMIITHVSPEEIGEMGSSIIIEKIGGISTIKTG